MSMMTVILFGFATAGALGIGFVGDRIGVPRALAGAGWSLHWWRASCSRALPPRPAQRRTP